MARKLSQSYLRMLLKVILHLLLILVWSFISLKINSYESQNGYFEIKALLQFKILLPVVVFGGRYLFFDKYRLARQNPWFLPLSLFIAGWSVFEKLYKITNTGYALSIIADSIIWAYMLKEILETIRTLMVFWKDIPKVNYAILLDIWGSMENDLIKLGTWLTILIGLAFFYLVNFFIVDALFYSYLLIIPLLGIGLYIYVLLFAKIKTWIRSDLAVINEELAEQLSLKTDQDDPELSQKTIWFQYLTLLRNYLNDLQRPAIMLKLFLFYLAFSGLILSLPYLLGRVIEV